MKRLVFVTAMLLFACAALAQTVTPPAGHPPTSNDLSEGAPAQPPATAPAPAPAAQNAAAAKPAPTGTTLADGKPTGHLFRGARVYIAPIEGGYDIYLTAAIQKKKVPVIIVTDRSKADFEIAGATDTEKANWSKMLFLGNDASNEQASIKVADLKTGEIVFGYNVNKRSSARGKQSSSEACAKHLKENIEEAK